MFITVLFIIVKNCKLPKCPSVDSALRMVKPTVAQLHHEILLSNKRGTVATQSSLDEPQGNCAKGKGKPQKVTWYHLYNISE